MTVSITYEVITTTPRANEYYVEFRVTSATDIDPAIFVFDVEYGAFTGVASPFDMQTWPVGQGEAQTQEKAYFRAPGVIRNLPFVDRAEYFEAYTKSRIKLLQEQYQEIVDGFLGEETVTTPTP